jgi:hypothetical protein
MMIRPSGNTTGTERPAPHSALPQPRSEASSPAGITDTAVNAPAGPAPASDHTGQPLAAEEQSGIRTLAAAPARPIATLQLPHALVALQAEFPGHQIGLQNLRGKFLYVARTRHLGLNPHTVITGDLDELAAALAPARPAREIREAGDPGA